MTEPVLMNRMEHFGGGTVDELADFIVSRGLDPSKVRVTACDLKYQSPETALEAEGRAKWKAQADRRTEEWELTTYERLRVKFGRPEDTPDPDQEPRTP